MTKDKIKEISQATSIADQIILDNENCEPVEPVEIDLNILRIIKEAADELIM